MNEVFDTRKKDGEWLCSEDKRLYNLQVESKGQVRYTTGKAASSKTIHPSKRRKMSLKPTVTTAAAAETEYQESEDSEEQSISTSKSTTKPKLQPN